jgi:hypothetical protein
MAQLQLFTSAQIAATRNRTKARNYSPAGDLFRREHARHREWGLQQRHARKLTRLYGSVAAAEEAFQRGADERRSPAAQKPAAATTGSQSAIAPGRATTPRPTTTAQPATTPRPTTASRPATAPQPARSPRPAAASQRTIGSQLTVASQPVNVPGPAATSRPVTASQPATMHRPVTASQPAATPRRATAPSASHGITASHCAPARRRGAGNRGAGNRGAGNRGAGNRHLVRPIEAGHRHPAICAHRNKTSHLLTRRAGTEHHHSQSTPVSIALELAGPPLDAVGAALTPIGVVLGLGGGAFATRGPPRHASRAWPAVTSVACAARIAGPSAIARLQRGRQVEVVARSSLVGSVNDRAEAACNVLTSSVRVDAVAFASPQNVRVSLLAPGLSRRQMRSYL